MTRRTARRQQRRSSRLRTLAVTSALTLGATVLGVAGAGGTYALLMAEVQTPAATITAGNLELAVRGTSGNNLGTWALTPATPVARAFTVASTGDVSATVSAKIAVTAAQPIATHTNARITRVAQASDCRTGLSGPQRALSGYEFAEAGHVLPAGQSATYCLELSLGTDTPAALSGQGVGFSLTINATQEKR